jgi:hypothetical protein
MSTLSTEGLLCHSTRGSESRPRTAHARASNRAVAARAKDVGGAGATHRLRIGRAFHWRRAPPLPPHAAGASRWRNPTPIDSEPRPRPCARAPTAQVCLGACRSCVDGADRPRDGGMCTVCVCMQPNCREGEGGDASAEQRPRLHGPRHLQREHRPCAPRGRAHSCVPQSPAPQRAWTVQWLLRRLPSTSSSHPSTEILHPESQASLHSDPALAPPLPE